MINVRMDPVVDALRGPNDPLRKRIEELSAAQAEITDDQRRENIKAAHQPNADPALRRALAAAREEVINLSVHAQNIVLALFANVEVAEDDWVQKVNRQDQKFKVYETHVHGMAPEQTYARPKSTAKYFLERYSTGVVDYPSEDGVLGRIDVSDEVNGDLIREWDNKINDKLDPLITAALGAFTDGETYVRDSRFVADTLPTTNVISSTGEAGFTFEIYKDAVEQFNLLSDNLKLIRLNPTEMRDTWAWQHLVSTTGSGSQDGTKMITTRIKDEVLRDGLPKGIILGQNVTYLLDPTFAKKKLQIFGTKPVGNFYSKPMLDKVEDFTEHEMVIFRKGDNMRGVQKSGYWLGLIYGPDALNFAEITFET